MQPTWIAWKIWPLEYVRAGVVSVLTLLYGLARILRVGKISALTVFGVCLLKREPFPREE